MKEQQGIELEHLCSAIGAVTLVWAQIERQLDNWKMLIFNRYNDHPICKKEPFTLKQKIDFLRRSFHKIKELSYFETRVNVLLENVQLYSDKRHAFVHGVVDSISSETFTFERIRLNKGVHYIVTDQFDLESYEKLLNDLFNLMNEMAVLSKDLLEKFSIKVKFMFSNITTLCFFRILVGKDDGY